MRLESLLEQSRLGEGRFAVIEGPAGIGKTALLRAVCREAADAGLTVLAARGTELERDFPFGIVRQLFEATLAAADEDDRSALLSGAARAAGQMLGYGAHDQPALDTGAMAAADSSFATLHGLYWLSSNLCDRGPVLLAIDDLQWADPASVRFLRFLLPRLPELPLLVLGAARSEEIERADDPKALLVDPQTVQLSLEPLSEKAVGRLAATTGAELVPEAVRACHQATGGNPFLVEELLREVASRGRKGVPADAELIRRAPGSVTRSVSLRISALDDGARALAEAIAILGDDVDPRIAAGLAGLDPEEASRRADALAASGLIRPGGTYSFLHPLVRGAVYSSIPTAERAARHERAASLLAHAGAVTATIALHLLGTEPAGRESVSATLRGAAREALESGATDTALTLLRRALAEPPPDEVLGELLLDFGVTGIWAASAEGFSALDRVIEIGDPKSVAAATSILAAALVMTGAAGRAVEVLDRGLGRIAPGDPEAALRVEAEVGVLALMDAATHAKATERIERLRARAGEGSAGARELLAASAFDLARAGEPADEVAAIAERALVGAEVPGDSVTFWQALSALLVSDRLEPAARLLDDASAQPGAGSPGVRLILNTAMRSRLAFLEGRIADAEADARLAVDAASMVELIPFMPHAVAYLIDTLVERGELDAAAEVDARVGDPPPNLAGSILSFSRSRLRLAQGRFDEGVAGLLELGERNQRIGLLNPAYLPWASTAAAASAGVGDERIRDGLAEELERARRWGTPRVIGLALRARGLVDGDLERLAEAVRLLERSPAQIELGRALTDLGAHLRRSNRRSQAREHLQRGLELATSCGATALADRARVELLAAGARPRPDRAGGAAALTPSERRVCELARGGLSNPEIAQRLFVTKKTVEFHLSNAYRKLDIGSRAELAEALDRASGLAPAESG